MHAAYSTVLRHVRHKRRRLPSYPAFYKLPNNNKKALPSLWEKQAGQATSPLWSTLKKQIRLVFQSFKLTSLRAFTLNLSALHRKKGCCFKTRKLQKITPLKSPAPFTNCPPAVPKAASSAGSKVFQEHWSPGGYVHPGDSGRQDYNFHF